MTKCVQRTMQMLILMDSTIYFRNNNGYAQIGLRAITGEELDLF